MKNKLFVLALLSVFLPLSLEAFEIPDLQNINVKGVQISEDGNIEITSDKGTVNVSNTGGVNVKTESGSVNVTSEQVQLFNTKAAELGIKTDITVEKGLVKVGDIMVTPGLVKLPGVTVTKSGIHTDNVDIQIADGKSPIEITKGTSLLNAEGKVFVTIGPSTVSAPLAETVISGKSVTIGEKDNVAFVSVGGTTAKSSAKIKLENGALSVVTADGDKQIKILPSETMVAAGSQGSVELNVENGKPVYSVTSTANKKLLGLFSVTLNKKTSIDAETGVKTEAKLPWWSFLAF